MQVSLHLAGMRVFSAHVYLVGALSILRVGPALRGIRQYKWLLCGSITFLPVKHERSFLPVKHECFFLPVEHRCIVNVATSRGGHRGVDGMHNVLWKWQQVHGDAAWMVSTGAAGACLTRTHGLPG